MVHFAYSHVAFVTLLAFAATVSGESMMAAEIKKRLAETESKIPGIISELKSAKEKVQNTKAIVLAKILSRNPSLRGELENYTKCLETTYTYKWGDVAFIRMANNLYGFDDEKLRKIRRCCGQKSEEYFQKFLAYHPGFCLEMLPSASNGDRLQLKNEIDSVFNQTCLFSVEMFYKKVYTTQLKMLKEN
ncbi:unnamed protein product [Trichobilharzia szidati]|nr:unnamed protein product [Trichobilharzia szidati]